jgi:hypothetical protein
MNTQIRAVSAPWHSGVEFFIGDPDGRTRVADIVMERMETPVERKPSFHLRMDMAQVLMDDLWNCGIRPTEGTGSAGALRAVESHRDDLRKIVFKQLDIK